MDQAVAGCARCEAVLVRVFSRTVPAAKRLRHPMPVVANRGYAGRDGYRCPAHVMHGPVLVSYPDLNGFEYGSKLLNPL